MPALASPVKLTSSADNIPDAVAEILLSENIDAPTIEVDFTPEVWALVSSAALPDLERVPGKQNWIEKLPAGLRRRWKKSWIYRTAKHLAAKGMGVGRAIAIAVNAAKKACSTGDLNWSGRQSINPKSRGEACAAVAVWTAMKAVSGKVKASFTLAARNNWRTQPRDPGGEGGGRWVKSGAAGAAGSGIIEKWESRGFVAATKEDRKRLSLPPAWKNVAVDRRPGASLLAVGTDAKGREQRVYSAEHHQKQAAEKFARIKELHGRLPAIDKRIAKDAGSNDTAAAAMLVRRMGLRPGSDADTGAEKKAHGATNLKAEHVSVKGNKVRLQFTGKKGVGLDLETDDAELARMLKARLKGKEPGDRLLDTNERKLRAYMKEVSPGVKPKDLRTYLATSTAMQVVGSLKPPTNKAEFTKRRAEVAKKVSEILGNTPTVALASYIAPSVFGPWESAVGA